MSEKQRQPISYTTASGRSGPMLLLLLAVVLIPTVCVLWFMNEVTQNEHLAVRKKLTDMYQSQLTLIRDHWKNNLANTFESVDDCLINATGAVAFHDTVLSRMADSIICYDQQGHQIYPSVPLVPDMTQKVDMSAWTEASRLEHVQSDYLNAATAYRSIANQALAEPSPHVQLAARALQAEARCFVQAERMEDAILTLTSIFGDNRFAEATDPSGRLIVADAELRALELIIDQNNDLYLSTLASLQSRLLDYRNRLLATAQRRFLMKRLQEITSAPISFPTLKAEQLASLYIGTQSAPMRDHTFYLTHQPDVWHIATSGGRAVLLFETAGLISRIDNLVASHNLPSEVAVAILPPANPLSSEDAISKLNVGQIMPGWQLTLTVSDPQIFQLATNRRITAYLWIGILVIGTTTILAVVVARTILQQTQLAQLKTAL